MFWKRPKPANPASPPRREGDEAEARTGAGADLGARSSVNEGVRISVRSEARNSRRPRSADDELECAVDSLAAVLRVLGRFAFELPDTDLRGVSEDCEAWASHLLLRNPAPGMAPPEDDGVGPLPRDWRGAAHYIAGLRKAEHTHLNKALTDLRLVIWAFAHGLNRAVVADEKADASLKSQLGRLSNAVRTSSTEELKREAMSVATSLTTLFESRRKEQHEQVAALGARMAALGKALEEARREGALDPLTRLFNRKTFDEELTRAVDLGDMVRRPASLVLVDVDHFKTVNDRYGHPAGDEVLRQLTGSLSRTFRHRDDIVARYGGEEFAIILRDTVLKDAITLSERLLASVRALAIACGDQTIAITVSAGVTERGFGETEAEWLARTDAALYEAKRAGRDRCVSG